MNTEIFTSLFNVDSFLQAVTEMSKELFETKNAFGRKNAKKYTSKGHLYLVYSHPKLRKIFYSTVFALARVCKLTWNIRRVLFSQITFDRILCKRSMGTALSSTFAPQNISVLSKNKKFLSQVVANFTQVVSLELGYALHTVRSKFVFDLAVLDNYPNIQSLTLHDIIVVGSTRKKIDIHLVSCKYKYASLGTGKVHVGDYITKPSYFEAFKKAEEIHIDSDSTYIPCLDGFQVKALDIKAYITGGLENAKVDTLRLRDIRTEKKIPPQYRFRREDIPAKTLIVDNKTLWDLLSTRDE
jgi:hypothetical protein